MIDGRCRGIILQDLSAEYERVRMACYEKRDFGQEGIRYMSHTF